MKLFESERRGWTLVALILLIGLLCVFIAATWAIRFSPGWRLAADMGSGLDPNSDFLPLLPDGVIQPLDPSILTPPVWIDYFLTPGASIPTRQPKATATPTTFIAPTQTVQTREASASPPSTLVFFLPTNTPISNPINTRTSEPPASTATPSPIPSSPPPKQADLQITKSNGVLVYSAGGTLTYSVVVTNNGPGNVTGALLSDNIQQQIASWSWACTSQNNGATGCDPADNSTGNFNDTVNLPSGGSIVYTVGANIRSDAAGNLINTASIQAPSDTVDPVPGNNSATDMDDLLNSLPYGEIGSDKDGGISVVPSGSSVTLAFNTPLIVDGHPGWDLVMYELPNGSGIAVDMITLQISDGSSWYTIFNWGDNIPDTNTNLDINIIGGIERDNRALTTIPASDVLYPFNSGTDANPATGIVIELDGVVPNGIYPYFRILSPAGDMDGGCEIDAIVILP